eukprot:tig00020610_g12052.t1
MRALMRARPYPPPPPPFFLRQLAVFRRQLRDLVESARRLSEREIGSILAQLASLDHIHSAPVAVFDERGLRVKGTLAHCDLTLDNVFYVQRGGRIIVKLGDFGICRIESTGASSPAQVPLPRPSPTPPPPPLPFPRPSSPLPSPAPPLPPTLPPPPLPPPHPPLPTFPPPPPPRSPPRSSIPPDSSSAAPPQNGFVNLSIAPEVGLTSGAQCDWRSDVFALGVILLSLWAGVAFQWDRDGTDPRDLVPALGEVEGEDGAAGDSRGLAALGRDLLNPDPARRPSAREVLRRLALGAGDAAQALRAPADGAPAPAPAPATAIETLRRKTWARACDPHAYAVAGGRPVGFGAAVAAACTPPQPAAKRPRAEAPAAAAAGPAPAMHTASSCGWWPAAAAAQTGLYGPAAGRGTVVARELEAMQTPSTSPRISANFEALDHDHDHMHVHVHV